jgi:hypothetical protein
MLNTIRAALRPELQLAPSNTQGVHRRLTLHIFSVSGFLFPTEKWLPKPRLLVQDESNRTPAIEIRKYYESVW